VTKIHRNDKKVAVDFHLIWGKREKLVENNKTLIKNSEQEQKKQGSYLGTDIAKYNK